MSHIPGPECWACLRKVAEETLELCGTAGEQRRRLLAQSEDLLSQGLAQGDPPAFIANRILARLNGLAQGGDPLMAKKAADMAAAREAIRALGPVPDTWAGRVRAAIMGNALDHFLITQPEEFWARGVDFTLGVDQLARAEERLAPGAEVVILADNAGEQCFDRLLVEHLLGRGCEVTYVVKSGPAQNDLTLADLKAQDEDYGLGRVMDSGTAQVGLDPAAVPEPLAGRLERADLVIAKGMGHYETLRRGAPWPLLFLFLAKCPPMARTLGVELGAGAAVLAA